MEDWRINATQPESLSLNPDMLKAENRTDVRNGNEMPGVKSQRVQTGSLLNICCMQAIGICHQGSLVELFESNSDNQVSTWICSWSVLPYQPVRNLGALDIEYGRGLWS